MKVTKGRAFVLSLMAVVMVYGVSALYLRLPSEAAALTAIVSLAGLYIGGNVADNRVKGKYFNEGLADK